MVSVSQDRPTVASGSDGSPRWVKVLDQTRCIGCHACTTACKSENNVPLGVTRTYVKSVDVGTFPQVRRAFQVTRCNQCENPPCVAACPTGAMYIRPDKIVDFDKRICIGCKACMAACPYDAIFINPEDHSAEKCNFCAHRLEIGLEPACVVVCPTEAILVGDLSDPTSKVSQTVHRQPVSVRRPEKKTRPKLFYKGAHQSTLDPLAAERPDGGTFMWSQMLEGPQVVNSGHPVSHGRETSAPRAVVSYDVAHTAPWGWRVSLYTWTKGISAGAYLVPALLAAFGLVSWTSPLVSWAAPLVALAFLSVTGVLLIWDLKHPFRFYMIFTKHKWGSWLVKGSVVISLYGLVLTAQLVTSVLGTPALLGASAVHGLSGTAHQALAFVGIPAAIATAIYTAFLFAQARARDLWQSPILAPHLAVEAVLAGSASMLPVAVAFQPAVTGALAIFVAAAAAAHLLLRLAETATGHPTAHAHLAAREMTHGRYASAFWVGAAMLAVGVLAPFVGWWAGLVALAGLLPHEHSYVQAAQSVPLA